MVAPEFQPVGTQNDATAPACLSPDSGHYPAILRRSGTFSGFVYGLYDLCSYKVYHIVCARICPAFGDHRVALDTILRPEKGQAHH